MDLFIETRRCMSRSIARNSFSSFLKVYIWMCYYVLCYVLAITKSQYTCRHDHVCNEIEFQIDVLNH